MTITILKAVLVIVIMAVMGLLLLSIHQNFFGNLLSSEATADRLREDLDESEEVISSESVFRDLVKVHQHQQSGRHL